MKLQYACDCCGIGYKGVHETSVEGLKICPTCWTTRCNQNKCEVKARWTRAIFRQELKRRVLLAKKQWPKGIKEGTWTGVADALLRLPDE